MSNGYSVLKCSCCKKMLNPKKNKSGVCCNCQTLYQRRKRKEERKKLMEKKFSNMFYQILMAQRKVDI